MDKLSLIGIVVALVAIGTGYALEGGMLASLLNLPALLIVLGGTLGAVMLQSPVKVFQSALKMFVWVFRPPVYPVDKGIHKVKGWAMTARQKGYLALEQEATSSKDPFVAKGLALLIDGVEHDQLRQTLEMELILERERLLNSARVYEAMGGYSPTIGILGAVLGLIQAMDFITEPQLLGAGIATAFVATIYGVGLANLFFIPVANKLKHVIEAKMQYHELLAEGFLAMMAGESPANIELKLGAFSDVKPSKLVLE